jgi:DNA-binding NtrC family response regulator
MSLSVFKLDSLLESHDLPFVMINAELKVVAVNSAWESRFGISRNTRIGQPCCQDNTDCRHKKLFQNLEPYNGIFPADEILSDQPLMLNVRGYPLLDNDSRLYLGESQDIISKSANQINSDGMIGKCPVFAAFKSKLEQAAEISAPVMLLGETGTGKELAAEFIHKHSKHANHEFVIADCTIFSEELFESEMFGHEKGAFTGAIKAKKGLLELANNGVLFLDEIGELPLSQQPKLLRALESGQFRRVGGTTTLRSTVRVICATHRNLSELVKIGQFREDLFYRLSVFPIELPPLRERKADLPLLVNHFLSQFNHSADNRYTLSQSATIKLIQHSWPGNVRELRNCLQLATGLCKNHVITDADINFVRRSLVTSEMNSPEVNPDSNRQMSDSLSSIEKFEAEFITDLIIKYQGNRKQIAAEMNISERTLYRKLHRLNLN